MKSARCHRRRIDRQVRVKLQITKDGLIVLSKRLSGGMKTKGRWKVDMTKRIRLAS